MNTRDERNVVAVMIDDHNKGFVRCWQVKPEGRNRRSRRLQDGSSRRSERDTSAGLRLREKVS